MWKSEKNPGRAALFATCCLGLALYAGGANADVAGASAAREADFTETDKAMGFASVPSYTPLGLRLPRAVGPPPFLLAESTVAKTVGDVTAATEEAAPASGVDNQPADNAAATPFGWLGWGLPPIRWGGSLVNEVRLQKATDQPRRLQQTETANIRASSYVWQPWFAQLSGGLGVLMNKERVGESVDATGNEARKFSSTGLIGDGAIAVFPMSRFPFSAHASVSDSRASGEIATSDFRNVRFGLRQSYRPLEGNTTYSANFDRSTLTSAAFGRDTVDALSANMNRISDAQTLNVLGTHTRNARSNTGERTALSQLTARHSYRPEPELSVESLASWTSSNFHLLSSGVPSDNRSQFAQANSFVTWRPDEDSPLLITGGGRMFRAVTTSNAVESESLTLSGNIGATYELTRQTRVSGSATVTEVLSDGRNALLTTQAAGVTHVGDPLRVLGGIYTWNAGANAANQTGAAEGTRQNVGGQVGHNFNRSVILGEGSQVNFGLGQTLGSTFDTVTAQSQTLSHTGSVSWSLTGNSRTSAYVGLLALDSRTSGEHANQFQMINLQASGRVQFNRNSSGSANLTLQGLRQSTDSTPNAGFNLTSSGNANYFHMRVFDVPRLRYTAQYTINDSQFRTRLQGDVDALRDRVTQSLEQWLDYNIGRVAMRLSMRIADVEGRRNALVFFRMTREFGAF